MELEEMRNTWQEMSKRIEKQEFLTNQVLEKMTNEGYNSKLKKIGIPEYIGTIICYIGAAYLIINFTKIEDTLIRVFALIAILLLFVLPIISLKSLRAMNIINISNKSYLKTIEDFGKRKIEFKKLQKLNVSLGFFLMLVTIPVLSAIQGKDIGQVPNFWTLVVPIFVTFFAVFAVWVLRYYSRVLKSLEKELTDFEIN